MKRESNQKKLRKGREKAEADITIVTLRVTYHCVCERKLTKIERNRRNMRRAAGAEKNVIVAAKK